MRIWDGTVRHPVERLHTISLCTTCMGRADDLQRTLPLNIELNRGYPNLEFVILDYIYVKKILHEKSPICTSNCPRECSAPGELW